MGLTAQQRVIRRRQIDLQRVRPGAESITDGFVTRAAGTPETIKGHIQPLTPEELRHLPEGQDSRNTRKIWTYLTDLQENDEITDPLDGQTLIVQKVEFWREGGFYEAVALRREGTL